MELVDGEHRLFGANESEDIRTKYFFQEFWYCLRNYLHYTDPKIWEDPDLLNTRGSVELFKYASLICLKF